MFDYHTHSSFSDDSRTPLDHMIQTAIRIGIKELAVTDHYDPGYPNQQIPFDLDLEAYTRTLDEKKQHYHGQIRIKKGIELGLQLEELEECQRVTDAYHFDFILGSFHASQGKELYGGSFFEGRSATDSYRAFYEEMYSCLSKFREYSVVGHFNIVDRYTDEIPPFRVYGDIVEEILKLMIQDEKGLEINTSSFRYGMGSLTTPSSQVLKLYHELGGTIITTGSDAHMPEDLGYRLAESLDLLRTYGFRWITSFTDRIPTQHSI